MERSPKGGPAYSGSTIKKAAGKSQATRIASESKRREEFRKDATIMAQRAITDGGTTPEDDDFLAAVSERRRGMEDTFPVKQLTPRGDHGRTPSAMTKSSLSP
jgi:hypothetical protein